MEGLEVTSVPHSHCSRKDLVRGPQLTAGEARKCSPAGAWREDAMGSGEKLPGTAAALRPAPVSAGTLLPHTPPGCNHRTVQSLIHPEGHGVQQQWDNPCPGSGGLPSMKPWLEVPPCPSLPVAAGEAGGGTCDLLGQTLCYCLPVPPASPLRLGGTFAGSPKSSFLLQGLLLASGKHTFVLPC